MIAATIAVSVLAAAAGCDGPDVQLTDQVRYHVRASDPRAAQWLQAGAAGSRTFCALLGRLSQSDLIVYVEVVDRIPGGAAGRIYFVTATAGARFMRIELVARDNAREMVAVAAHELQHAVEIADAPRVRDPAAMAMLYRLIGEDSLNRSQFESAVARVTEERVRSELAGARSLSARSGDPARGTPKATAPPDTAEQESTRWQ